MSNIYLLEALFASRTLPVLSEANSRIEPEKKLQVASKSAARGHAAIAMEAKEMNRVAVRAGLAMVSSCLKNREDRRKDANRGMRTESPRKARAEMQNHSRGHQNNRECGQMNWVSGYGTINNFTSSGWSNSGRPLKLFELGSFELYMKYKQATVPSDTTLLHIQQERRRNEVVNC